MLKNKIAIKNDCRFHPKWKEPCPVCLADKKRAEKLESEYEREQRELADLYHRCNGQVK